MRTEFEAKLEKVLENILIQMQNSVEISTHNMELSKTNIEMFRRISKDITDLKRNMNVVVKENGKLKKMLGFIISVSDLDTKSRKAKIKKIKEEEPSLFSQDELHNDLPF